MSANLADDELLIQRTFNAPVATVFSLWSDPEHMKRWMGPADFECPEAEIDFRVGGAYRVTIRSQQHGLDAFGGVYREIEPNKRLVFTFAWDNAGPSAGIETLVTILFAEQGGKTIQTFHQTRFQSTERRDNHVGGWNRTFDKQQAYAEKLTRERAS